MPSTSATPNLRADLTVETAARLLGVYVETLRRWDRAGKTQPIRHPLNGYRLYDGEQLPSLLCSFRSANRRDADMPANSGGRAHQGRRMVPASLKRQTEHPRRIEGAITTPDERQRARAFAAGTFEDVWLRAGDGRPAARQEVVT